MPRRRWDIRIRDILSSIAKIQDYTKALDCDGFQTDSKTVDAVVRNIEIIGEAALHVPEAIIEFPGKKCVTCATCCLTNILALIPKSCGKP